MVRSHAFGLAFSLLVVFPSAGSAFTAANGMTVNPEGARSFVVVPVRGKNSTTDYWCAAGDFAIRRLGLRPSTRLFRMTSGGGNNGMTFSLDQQGSVSSGVTVFGAKDNGLSASLAQVYCTSMRKDDFFDR